MSQLLALKLQQITTPSGYEPKSTGADVSPFSAAAEKLISNSLVVLTVIAGISFVLYFLIGALQWITAGGQKDKVQTAQSMMTNGAIGLIIVVLSYAIVWIVGKAVGLNILEPATLINNLTFR